jgi:uncharacterized protein YcfJ
MRLLRSLFALVAILATAPTARAQYAAPGWMSTGSRIRVTAPSLSTDPIVGRLLLYTTDSLLLAAGDGEVRMRVPMSLVRTVEVSEGRDRLDWAVKGAGIGLVAGILIGGAAFAHSEANSLASVAGGIAGGVIGAPLGGVVGALAAPERWAPGWRLERP